MFKRIGGVFWYTEQRTSYSLAPFLSETTGKNGETVMRQTQDDESIRRLFIQWFAASREKVERFNEYYKQLFPSRFLSSIGKTQGLTVPPVLFEDGDNEYDLKELSGGERALIPLLVDFVEWDIHNSIILIDEIELHLHPPLQQALLMLLPKLGGNNQFIITTHSNSIANLVDPESIIRVTNK